MPIDFSLPLKGQHYDTGVLQSQRDHQAALARWLDPATAGTVTSPPTGAYRLNSGNLERYNGTSWVAQSINGISVVSGMSNVGDLQQGNANYLRGKIAAGTATRLFGLNASNVLYLGSLDVAHGSTLFVNNGVTHMTWTSTGNFGVGRTPTNKFEVQGDVAAFWDAAGANFLTFAPSAAGNASQINGNAGLSLRAGGSEAINVSTTLNTGIGSAADGSVRLKVQATDPTRGILAMIRNAAGGSGAQFHITQSGIADWVIGQPAGVNAFAIWQGRNSVADGTELLRLTSGGLGLGTNNPGTKLDVVGNGRFTLANDIAVRALSGASGSHVSIALGRTAIEHYVAAAAVAGNYASGSAAGDMVLNTTGRVVIGTASTGRVFVAPEGVTLPTQPGFAAQRTGSSVAPGAAVPLIFNTEDHDIGNCYDSSTGVFTAPVAGRYLVSGYVVFSNTVSSGVLNINLYKNGSVLLTNIIAGMVETGTTQGFTFDCGVVALAQGDTLDLRKPGGFVAGYAMEVNSRFSVQLLA